VQVAFADRLLLDKTDLDSSGDLGRVEGRLRGINRFAPIQRCTRSEVAVDQVLNIHGFNLQRALETNPGLLDADTAPTKHNGGVTCVSLDQSPARHLRTVAKGDLDLHLVQRWIEELLRTSGADIFRMKGVLAIAHAHRRYVCHGVHAVSTFAFDEAWDDAPKESRLVFIGKNLDEFALSRAFNECLATPENLERRQKALRFAVSDKVECKTDDDDEWSVGTVASLLWRNDRMPPGVVAPYQIQLDDGTITWVPSDCDSVIRAAPSFEHVHAAELPSELAHEPHAPEQAQPPELHGGAT